MKILLKMTIALGVSLLAACGGTGDGNTDGEMRGAYPAGPYGMGEDTVIESLPFLMPDGQTRTLEDVWKDNTKKLMLITTSAGWCTACIDEQPALKEYHQNYGPKGLFILEAVFEDGAYMPATVEYTASWKRQYDLPFEVVADVDFKLGRYYNRELSPMNMIVDVTTMKILRITSGFDPNATEAILDARLK
jgi:thiol-disulfide isomerase/thioredoxin